MSLNVVDERGQGSAGKSLMFFVKYGPDWSTVSFWRGGFWFFDFISMKSFMFGVFTSR